MNFKWMYYHGPRNEVQEMKKQQETKTDELSYADVENEVSAMSTY